MFYEVEYDLMITTISTGKKPNNPPNSPGEALERWRKNPNIHTVSQVRQSARERYTIVLKGNE
jgi:hypothetical protein